MILTDKIIWQAFRQKLITVCQRNILIDSSPRARRYARNMQDIFDAKRIEMEKRYPEIAAMADELKDL